MSEDFYSKSQQLRRELRYRYRGIEWIELFVASIVTLTAFYALFSPGRSQVYDVALPYLFASIHLGYLVFRQTGVERSHPTSNFFINLPRTASVTFFATILYFMTYAIYYEIIIALGVAFKLGGADITPYYRLHPEIVILPMVVTLGMNWFCHGPRSFLRSATAIMAALVLIGALVLRYFSLTPPSPENNFLPPRDLPLLWAWAMAAVLVLGSVGLCSRVRHDMPAEQGSGR